LCKKAVALMPDDARVTGILDLAAEFPPIAVAEWEAAIRKDLKGADYEKELVWRAEEGISVRPYYTQESLQALGELVDLAPGEQPFTRGTGQAWQEAQSWIAPASAVRADHLHEAGASTVQELAFALAEAVEKLQSAIDAGQIVETAAPAIQFVYAIGSNHFFEIAKPRAARTLWSAAVEAFGCKDSKAALAHIHARTARNNKSVLDPYTNLLRVTTESLSAIIGGCDSLTVEPFGFDPHLALNVQRLLRDEVHLDKVADPAGGSYYVEFLTNTLAQQAWKLFQEVETLGGWSKALASGFVDQALAKSRDAKAKAMATRRKTMVGVNNYANAADDLLKPSAPASLPDDRFPQTRLAEPFEKIRARTAQHIRLTGKSPKVLLLKRGDLKMKIARANFCLSFFGCAGFQMVEADDYKGTDADRIVLCSSDPEYVALAQEVCAATAIPVFVAGNPKAQIAELEKIGVRGFIHVLSNIVETLTQWQNELGMSEWGKQ
jgi:methylmalonyl-CoA mutase